MSSRSPIFNDLHALHKEATLTCVFFGVFYTRWAPTIYKWSCNPYKWPYKWVTGVITLLIGVITPFITGRGPPCRVLKGRSKGRGFPKVPQSHVFFFRSRFFVWNRKKWRKKTSISLPNIPAQKLVFWGRFLGSSHISNPKGVWKPRAWGTIPWSDFVTTHNSNLDPPKWSLKILTKSKWNLAFLVPGPRNLSCSLDLQNSPSVWHFPKWCSRFHRIGILTPFLEGGPQPPYANKPHMQKKWYKHSMATRLGPLLTVKLLVGYMQNPTKLKGAKGIRLT